MTDDFWPRAWALEAALGDSDPTAVDPPSIVRELPGDFVLQRFIFLHRGWADSSWFVTLRAGGLFDSPPDVERVAGGLRTQAWPALTYLKRVAGTHAGPVAEILGRLQTENWWVITDGLDATEDLPDELALPAVAHLLAEWQRTPVSWSDPRLLVRVLKRVINAPSAGVASVVSVARVLDRLWGDHTDRYELDEVLRGLGDLDTGTRFLVADGIELVLTGRRGQRRFMSQSFGPRLEDLNVDRSDPAELLAARWLELTQDEPKERGADAALRRAIRLLAVSDALVRQMGLRSLRVALDARPSDTFARRLLTEVAQDERLLEHEGEISELLGLFRAHFGLLDPEGQASFVERLIELAASDQVSDRYYARDWLNAVRAHLGPRERVTLASLETELGTPRERFETPRAVAGFVGPVGPLTSGDAAAMSATDLLAMMRNVPRIESDYRDSSVESIARLVKAQIERRPQEFLPILDEIASTVDYPVILHHIIWGLSELYAKEEARDQDVRNDLLRFIATVAERAQAATLDEESHYGYGTNSLLRAIADFLEDLAPWLATSTATSEVLTALDAVLSSQDPTPDHEERFGGSNMNPPDLALNTARGRGVRAMLHLLIVAAEDESRADLVAELSERARRHASAEWSPSALSGYGFYLPWLVTRTPDLWAQVKPDVLPSEGSELKWEAVFTTYVTFNRLYPAVANDVREHYLLAISRVSDSGLAFLQKHADRLLQHLITLALPDGQGSEEWSAPLEAALAAVPEGEAQSALTALGHAVRREGLDLSLDWVMGLTTRRLDAMRAQRRPEEATGFLELLEAMGAPPARAGGAILNLMYAGATVRTWSLIEYLDEFDAPRSDMGVRILLRAMEVKEFGAFVRDQESFGALLADYATAAPIPTWKLVNELAAVGMFSVEETALVLAPGANDGDGT